MKEYYHIHALKPDIFRITSAEGVFCDLFVGCDRALLFDTGYGFGNIREVVRGLTDKPLVIVNSHGHLDHTCGNGWFEENIFIHPKDMELCREHTSEAARRHGAALAAASKDLLTGQIHNTLPERFDEEKYVHLGSGRLLPVREGDIFELGGITLKVVEVPGHTAGSIALIYDEEKWLYAGDAMNSFTWLFAKEAQPLSVYIASIKKAIGLGMKKVIVSHYPDRMDSDVLNAFLSCAQHVDFDRGIPFDNPILPGYDARVCSECALDKEHLFDPYHPALVISREKLDL